MSEESASADSTTSAPAGPPVLRVVTGNPTPEEVAAVTVVLTALSGGGADEATAVPLTRVGGWADRGAGLRQPMRTGAGAWRASSWR
jgi:hypothetical protein